jgi:hypothetical protein
MKRAALWILFLAGSAAAAWLWTAQVSADRFPEARRAWQFRHPGSADLFVRQRMSGDRQVRELRRASRHTADVTAAVREEMELWEKQFHLGEADREERLGLQRLTRSDVRGGIQSALEDEAFLKTRFQAIPEEAARAWYKAHARELRVPTLHRVSHIFLSRHGGKKPDRSAEMQRIHRELQNGASFAALAARYSEDARSKTQGGDLGWFTAGRMPEDFMKEVVKLRAGAASGPVETRLGWHVLLVTERREPRVPAFEEVREEILALLDHERRARFQP